MPAIKLKNHYALTLDLEKKARLLALAGDPTRLRIICFMLDCPGNPCVSEIAGGLNMSLPAISHHLQVMRDNGLLKSTRKGNNICYSLQASPFLKDLKQLICR